MPANRPECVLKMLLYRTSLQEPHKPANKMYHLKKAGMTSAVKNATTLKVEHLYLFTTSLQTITDKQLGYFGFL